MKKKKYQIFLPHLPDINLQFYFFIRTQIKYTSLWKCYYYFFLQKIFQYVKLWVWLERSIKIIFMCVCPFSGIIRWVVNFCICCKIHKNCEKKNVECNVIIKINPKTMKLICFFKVVLHFYVINVCKAYLGLDGTH